MVAPILLALTILSADENAVVTATISSAPVTTQKRAMPSYDGREPAPPTAGDNALWAPRIVLFPVYLVSEYVLRRPLEWLIVNAEKNQWPTLVLDFFTFGENRTSGVFPSGLIDFGFRPSVGIYAFSNELVAKENSVRLYAAYGGNDWYAVRVADRIDFNEKNRLAFSFGYTHRPDFRFEGLGPSAPSDFLTRYRAERIEASASFDSIIRDAGHFSAFAGARDVNFQLGQGGCCDDRALEDVVAAGEIAAPPGFGTDYTVWEHGVNVEFDTRRPRPANGNGMRLEMNATQALPLSASLRSPWITFGGSLGGFLDLNDRNRVISLFVSSEFIEPIEHDQTIPFTELMTLGGPGQLPGFRPGTLLGQSRINGQLEYRWPIWAFLDGTIHLGVGNVFGERLEGFRWDLLRMSFGFGMRTSGRRDHAFNILVAAGTEPFAGGLDITTFRFVIGTTRGF